MAILNIIKEIDSAHGRKEKIHGHTFKIEIELQGKVINNMVDGIDFHEIMPFIDKTIKKLNKTYIEDVIQTRGTVENIAIYIINNLKEIDSLYSVTVWEGKNKNVKIFKEEVN